MPGQQEQPGPDERDANAFVGRIAELAQLHAALAEIEADGPRCVLIEGPGGIGKSTLIRRLLAELPHVRAVTANADESESLIEYTLADQLLRSAGVARPQLFGRGGVEPDFAAVGLELLEALSAGVAGRSLVKRATVLARIGRTARKAGTVGLRLKATPRAAAKLRLALRARRTVTATVAVKTTLAGGTARTQRLRIAIPADARSSEATGPSGARAGAMGAGIDDLLTTAYSSSRS